MVGKTASFADGVLEVYKDGDFLHVIRRDELFGELAILHHCRRTATIKGELMFSSVCLAPVTSGGMASSQET